MLILFFSIMACTEIDQPVLTEPELPALTTGSADFSNYVAAGGSFTAGFSDGALFIAGQENSFPNILAQAFAEAGGGNFTQPLMNDNVGGLLLGGNVIQSPRLYFDGSGPVGLPATPSTEVTNVKPGPYKNMGVPGIKSFHFAVNGYGNVAGVATGAANPYYARMASSATASVMEDVLSQSPSFFTLSEVGGNDVLAYAIAGGDGTDQKGNYNPATYGPNDITDPVVFGQVFNGMIVALTANGAKGVITTVPYITDLPHFTTVPYNPLSPTNPDYAPMIPTLNSLFGALNQVYAYLGVPERSVTFSTSAASAVVIKDENLPDLSTQITAVLNANPSFPAFVQQFGLPAAAAPVVANLLGVTYGQTRQATSDDLLVLPSSSVIGTVNTDAVAYLMSQGLPQAIAGQFSVEGITLPLADKWVLLPEEQQAIKDATDAYNLVIQGVADSNANVAVVDLKALLQQASGSGLIFDEFTMTTQLVLGGLVSLDGIHLTARGYALMATEFLKAIDDKFGSNFIEAGVKPNALDYNSFYPVSL